MNKIIKNSLKWLGFAVAGVVVLSVASFAIPYGKSWEDVQRQHAGYKIYDVYSGKSDIEGSACVATASLKVRDNFGQPYPIGAFEARYIEGIRVISWNNRENNMFCDVKSNGGIVFTDVGDPDYQTLPSVAYVRPSYAYGFQLTVNPIGFAKVGDPVKADMRNLFWIN